MEKTVEAQGPVDVNVSRHQCAHCGCEIRHYGGRLWHEIGEKIFPQYCVDSSGSSAQLHEPADMSANAKVSGAGTASAGLPGYAGDNNGE